MVLFQDQLPLFLALHGKSKMAPKTTEFSMYSRPCSYNLRNSHSSVYFIEDK